MKLKLIFGLDASDWELDLVLVTRHYLASNRVSDTLLIK
jgi:hypothetical protein